MSDLDSWLFPEDSPRHIWTQYFAANSCFPLDGRTVLRGDAAAHHPVARRTRGNADSPCQLSRRSSYQNRLPEPLHIALRSFRSCSEGITKEADMHERITIVGTIAERIKKTRIDRGMTQGQLADAVGISQSSIGNIESGVRKRPRELLSIAQALGVAPEWLETGKRGAPVLQVVSTKAEGAESTARALVTQLAALAARQRPTLRKNLGNLLVELVEHPEDPAVVEQTIADIERFFG